MFEISSKDLISLIREQTGKKVDENWLTRQVKRLWGGNKGNARDDATAAGNAAAAAYKAGQGMPQYLQPTDIAAAISAGIVAYIRNSATADDTQKTPEPPPQQPQPQPQPQVQVPSNPTPSPTPIVRQHVKLPTPPKTPIPKARPPVVRAIPKPPPVRMMRLPQPVPMRGSNDLFNHVTKAALKR